MTESKLSKQTALPRRKLFKTQVVTLASGKESRNQNWLSVKAKKKAKKR